MEQGTSSPAAPRRRGYNFIDRTGKRYGKLVAVRVAERHPGDTDARWVCQCDCGNETIARSSRLKTGHTRSCGCGMSDPRIAPGRSTRNVVRREYRASARRRGYSWGLTDDEFDRLITQPCFYCGLAPSRVRVYRGKPPVTCGGIDRKDNNLGYTTENTVPCCQICNAAKSALSYDEFMAWIARLTEYQFFRPDLTPSRLLRDASKSTA